MFNREDVVIDKRYEYVYCARLPGLDIYGYGFSENQAIEALTKRYNIRAENLAEGNKIVSVTNPSV